MASAERHEKAADTRAAAKAWLRQETRLGSHAARPVVVLSFAAACTAIAQAYCVAAVLAAALTGRGRAVPPLVLFALLALVRAALSWAAELRATRAGAASRRRLRSEVMTRLLHAGPGLLRERHSGELAATVVDRVEALDGLYARWIPASTLAVLVPIVVGLAALAADPVAAGVLLLCGLLVPIGMATAGLGAAAASRRQFLALARLQARFLDRVRGVATIVLYGRAADEAAALARAADELRRRTMRVLRVAFLSSAVLDLAGAAALVILAVRYGLMIVQHRLNSPTAALFALLLVPEFFGPLRGFAAAYQDHLHATGAADEIMRLPPAAAPIPPPAREVRTVPAHGVTVAFDDVRLTWDTARGPALDGLSFRVPAGETLVLAGPSGAGKSSVIEILLGFVRPDSGRVTVNGADIADLVPEALSRLTAWIGQRPVLFAGTIRENIRFARPEAGQDQVEEAARAARVVEFAAGLPDGLDTPVGEGGYGLSGGQAQRVAIARAFLKNAPLLLLDEPTAHLDPTTEAEVLDSLRRLALGRTVILASHSSAAHAFAGRRVDLRDGRAVPVRVSA
ncbi:MAG TPA: thiol reductant ABC exporter subunit CydD [Acetobacteraceae bacterium]|nr:thiol reductant ABC exporter subunit CydD [Acetobacteraceae bacterium]